MRDLQEEQLSEYASRPYFKKNDGFHLVLYDGRLVWISELMNPDIFDIEAYAVKT